MGAAVAQRNTCNHGYKCACRRSRSRFDAPAYVHSDLVRQFDWIVYQEDLYVSYFGIKKKRTMPYHPESDGMVEHYNKTLAKLL